MNLNILQPSSFISQRFNRSSFLTTVLKVIEEYQKIHQIESDWSAIVSSYCQDYFQSETRSSTDTEFRKVYHQLVTCFKQAERDLRYFITSEKCMDSRTHKVYLEYLAVAEITGNLIISPNKINLNLRAADSCSCCSVYQIIPSASFASDWARNTIVSIEIGHCVKFVWGDYSQTERAFLPPVARRTRDLYWKSEKKRLKGWRKTTHKIVTKFILEKRFSLTK